MEKTKSKPVPGHKRGKVLYATKVVCECGWESSHWYGKGASANAHAEWRGHVQACSQGQKA